jgi:hypothetical protein
VLADHSLEDEAGSLLRSLVPVSAPNRTSLDTLLSYLLIANHPDDKKLLKAIVKETGPVVFENQAPSVAQIGPDPVVPA